MEQKLRLGYFTASIGHFELLRELTEEEIEKNRRFTPLYREIESRFELFRILTLNFEAWQRYTDSLLTVKPDTGNEMLVADQLLFNLLAAAYGITEHFNTFFRRRFRKQQDKLEAYEAFLDRLCAGSWAVAFFFDFRNYVQHSGLPVGRYNKHLSRTKIEITIEQDAAELVTKHRDWRRSQLNASHGKLDLVKLSFDYHLYLKRDYARYVANALYPELVEIQDFYSALTKEATDGDANKRMILISRVIEAGFSSNITALEPPNDPLAAIGILVERKVPVKS